MWQGAGQGEKERRREGMKEAGLKLVKEFFLFTESRPDD